MSVGQCQMHAHTTGKQAPRSHSHSPLLDQTFSGAIHESSLGSTQYSRFAILPILEDMVDCVVCSAYREEMGRRETTKSRGRKVDQSAGYFYRRRALPKNRRFERHDNDSVLAGPGLHPSHLLRLERLLHSAVVTLLRFALMNRASRLLPSYHLHNLMLGCRWRRERPAAFADEMWLIVGATEKGQRQVVT